MWFVLSFAAALLICVVSWGTVVMLCMRNWTLAGIGALVLVGMILLVWVVAFVYWAIEEFACRARLWQELKTAKNTHGIDKQKKLRKRLEKETWAAALGMSSMIWLRITVYGIAAPISLLFSLWYWLRAWYQLSEVMRSEFSHRAR